MEQVSVKGHMIEDIMTWFTNGEEEYVLSQMLAINSTEKVNSTAKVSTYQGPYNS
jgi:hypothetical protein